MARGDRISFRGGAQVDAPLLLAIVAVATSVPKICDGFPLASMLSTAEFGKIAP